MNVNQFQHRSNALSHSSLAPPQCLPSCSFRFRNWPMFWKWMWMRWTREMGEVDFITYTHNFTLTKCAYKTVFLSFYHLIWRIINRITHTQLAFERTTHQTVCSLSAVFHSHILSSNAYFYNIRDNNNKIEWLNQTKNNNNSHNFLFREKHSWIKFSLVGVCERPV